MTLVYAFFLTPVGLMTQLRSKTVIAIPICLLALGFQTGLGDHVIGGTYEEYTVGGTLNIAMTVFLLSTAFWIRQTNVYKVSRGLVRAATAAACPPPPPPLTPQAPRD